MSEGKTKFRLPRRVKRKLKKGLWLYPADEKGNSLMAWPTSSEKDYLAYKEGIVKDICNTNEGESKEEAANLSAETIVTDEQLKEYVDGVFRKDLRFSAYNTFREAKKNPKAISAYYNFVNAYRLYEQGESSYGNICCLALDAAHDSLKKKRVKNNKNKKRRR